MTILALILHGSTAFGAGVEMQQYHQLRDITGDLVELRAVVDSATFDIGVEQHRLETSKRDYQAAVQAYGVDSKDAALAHAEVLRSQRDLLQRTTDHFGPVVPRITESKDKARSRLVTMLRKPANVEQLLAGHLRGRRTAMGTAVRVYIETARLERMAQRVLDDAYLGVTTLDIEALHQTLDLIEDILPAQVTDADLGEAFAELSWEGGDLSGNSDLVLDELDRLEP